jgi:hypothetical protein
VKHKLMKIQRILTIITIALLMPMTALGQAPPAMGSSLEWVIMVDPSIQLSGYKIYYGLDGSPVDQVLDLSDVALVRADDQSGMAANEELYEYNLLQSPFQIGSQYCFQVTGYLTTAVAGSIRESIKSDVACGLVVPILNKVIRVRLTK